MNGFFSSGRGKWLLTTGSAYIYFASIIVITGITVPLSLKYLGPARYGLWAISSQLLSYVLLLDGGLSRSLQRLVGEAVTNPKNGAAIRRFSVLIVLTFFMAAFIWSVAYAISGWGLRVLSVPQDLQGLGQKIFLSILSIQCVGYAFGPFDAVLFARNRVYLSTAIRITAVWLNLACLWILLVHGVGLMSYVYANISTFVLIAAGQTLFFWTMPERPPIRLDWPHRNELHDVFSFSGWLFLHGFVVEAQMALPMLLVAKFDGLRTAAIFYITLRPAFFLHRFSVLPFESIRPRWQALYLEGNLDKLRKEYYTGLVLVIQLGLALCTCFVVALKPFIIVWVGLKMYGGSLLTTAFGLYLTVYLLGFTLAFPFVWAKKFAALTLVQAGELILAVPLGIFLVQNYGPAALILGLVSLTVFFTVQYCWRAGPKHLAFTCSLSELLRLDAAVLAMQIFFMVIGLFWVWLADAMEYSVSMLILGGGVICLISGLYLFKSTFGLTQQLFFKTEN